MLTHTNLALIAIVIGVLVGAVGVGGFFMPPALTLRHACRAAGCGFMLRNL